MKTFRQFVVDYKQEVRDEYLTKADVCFGQISEASLSRLWQQSQNNDFGIITAYRGNETKESNVLRNRELRNSLNQKRLGVYPLVGHWQECEDPSIPYDECPPEKLKDVIERSYFVPRNKNISPDDFKNLLFELAKKYQQDAIILKIDYLGLFGVYESKTGNELVKFEKNVRFNKVQQAYSQYVKKLNVPFIFEGIEFPECIGLAKEVYRKMGFLW